MSFNFPVSHLAHFGYYINNNNMEQLYRVASIKSIMRTERSPYTVLYFHFILVLCFLSQPKPRISDMRKWGKKLTEISTTVA